MSGHTHITSYVRYVYLWKRNRWMLHFFFHKRKKIKCPSHSKNSGSKKEQPTHSSALPFLSIPGPVVQFHLSETVRVKGKNISLSKRQKPTWDSIPLLALPTWHTPCPQSQSDKAVYGSLAFGTWATCFSMGHGNTQIWDLPPGLRERASLWLVWALELPRYKEPSHDTA